MNIFLVVNPEFYINKNGVNTYVFELCKLISNTNLVVLNNCGNNTIIKKLTHIEYHISGNQSFLNLLKPGDIVHFNQYYDIDLLKSINALGCKTVVTSHVFNIKNIEFYNNAATIICPSYGSKNQLVNVEISPLKIMVIYNGLYDNGLITIDKAKVKQELGIGENKKILLFAGRIEKNKGVEELRIAFDTVNKKYPDTILIIAGKGIFDKYFKNSNNILYAGVADKKMLNELYSIADIGVVPSYNESFGYVAAEMSMFSLPIIATNTLGLNEIINDEINGLLIPFENQSLNPELIAEKIIHLLNNQQYAAQLGQNARQKYLNNFSSNIYTSKMLEFYTNI